MNNWIPIENVVPKNMDVIAYSSSGLIALLHCDDSGGFSFIWNDENTEDNISILGEVVAWMPCPEDYRYEKCERDVIKFDLIDHPKADIERLSQELDISKAFYKETQAELKLLKYKYSKAKTKAIKEFVERLKSEITKEFDNNLCLTLYTGIDNLVKEMTK